LLWYLAKGIDFIWYIPPCFGPGLSWVLSTRIVGRSWTGRGAGVGRLRFFTCLFVVGFMLVDINAPNCSDQIWGLGFLLAVIMLLWLELGAARKATIISNKVVVCTFLQVWMFSTMIPLPVVPGGNGRRK
jgi:hypothetical protein